MIIAIPVTTEGLVAPGWGRAAQVAIATIDAGTIGAWQVHDVGWDTLHDAGTSGAHHARVVTFLLDQQVEEVVVDHVGQGMQRILDSMGITLVTGASGDAKRAALAASW
jgi:predicted Fe-Mo cluster-binding NifX family protein